ncbi:MULTISPECIES: response regulator [unclassified Flavobacterium]|uniref:response regulator n=1 Tax=unclassified Flavobacterium TaxID=196869 RepID=UPI003F9259BB
MKKIETIAVIDDDDIYQFTAQRTFKTIDTVKNVYIFSDGKEAIDYFSANINNQEKLPDVIFLDLNMPIMDGWQFLREYILLKPSIGKNIIIYIVSSSMNPDDLLKAKTISEVHDYIVKPITVDKFRKIISAIEL